MNIRDAALEFESLGDNCEFAFFQKAVGADQLGLLRWLGLSAEHLITCLQNQFDGIDDPEKLEFRPQSNGEYIVYIKKFNAQGHTGVFADQQSVDQIAQTHAKKLTFLKNKLISDLRSGEKIFVYKQNEPIREDLLHNIFAAVAAYGPNTLLLVQEDRGAPIYKVGMRQDGLILGYIRRLAARDFVADFSYTGWYHLCHAVIKLREAGGDGAAKFRCGSGASAIQHALSTLK